MINTYYPWTGAKIEVSFLRPEFVLSGFMRVEGGTGLEEFCLSLICTNPRWHNYWKNLSPNAS
jgi:hypothetical protein